VTNLTIKGDLAAIERALKEEPKLARRAAVSALNKTVGIAQTAGVRELARAKKLPTSIVKGRTRVIRASQRRLLAKFITLTAGVPIDRLSYRELRQGISAAGQKFPHAFTNNVGRPVIFERKVIGGKRVGRLPIERVKFPLNPEADQIFARAVDGALNTNLRRIFESELAYRLARR
jgi:hypothetical protein